jgi:hypothetical protein
VNGEIKARRSRDLLTSLEDFSVRAINNFSSREIRKRDRVGIAHRSFIYLEKIFRNINTHTENRNREKCFREQSRWASQKRFKLTIDCGPQFLHSPCGFNSIFFFSSFEKKRVVVRRDEVERFTRIFTRVRVQIFSSCISIWFHICVYNFFRSRHLASEKAKSAAYEQLLTLTYRLVWYVINAESQNIEMLENRLFTYAYECVNYNKNNTARSREKRHAKEKKLLW